MGESVQRVVASAFRGAALRLGSVALLLAGGSLASAQDPNACDAPGDKPDVIVGDLFQVGNYGRVGDIYAYSVGTISCNIGSCWLNWISNTSEHPVIGQNMYRLKDGRYTQVGQSWLKHGFTALSGTLCSSQCIATDGTHLGVNCSDPYSSSLNGSQGRLGPRFEVNPSTGVFAYPFSFQNVTGDAIFKRLQVHVADLDPLLNAGARYFVEGQYVARDDSAVGAHFNNASYREILVNPLTLNISLTGATQREQAGIQAWADVDPAVQESFIDVANDGRFIVAAKATNLGGGSYRYEYAVQNLNSHRAARAFVVPVAAGTSVIEIGFHDVDYHSGEPYDGTDWSGAHEVAQGRVIWSTLTYAESPDANALRWGTLYNFWFVSSSPPRPGQVSIELFRPPGAGEPQSVAVFTVVPDLCNHDGICQAPAEDCGNCAADCVTVGGTTGFCGDGLCEIVLGEDCTNCLDCAGVQGGNPGGRFCCGAGGGQNPVDCSDPRCTAGVFDCGSSPGSTFCCGSGTCDTTETSCICATDCGAPETAELLCADGADDDCDGKTDCADADCCADAACGDGIDDDGDGVADCDCDDGNPAAWAKPGEATDLILSHDLATGTTLSWSAPAEPGATTPAYHTLRSANPKEWMISADCLSDPTPTDTTSVDPLDPPPNGLFAYLVRAANGCPDGVGSTGSNSSGQGRACRTCP